LNFEICPFLSNADIHKVKKNLAPAEASGKRPQLVQVFQPTITQERCA
jgi:hypothetical protein